MSYVIFAAIAIIVITLLILEINKSKARTALEGIRSRWINPKDEYFNFSAIERYSNTINDKGFHKISAQTIGDIDFYNLFQFLDRTTSKIGQQFLFNKLVRPSKSSSIKQEQYVDLLMDNQPLREDIQLELHKLGSNDAYKVSSLLSEQKLVKKPAWLSLIIVDIAVTLALLLLSFKYPVCLIILVAPFTINTFIYYWSKINILMFATAFSQLNLLITASHSISKKHTVLHDTVLANSVSEFAPFQRKLALLSKPDDGRMLGELAQIAKFFQELLKVLFPLEMLLFFQLVKELETKKSSIAALFEYVGEIDTAISVAAIRAGSLKTCKPEFTANKKELFLKNVYHPLIKGCTPNDLLINNKGVLITGSNMSGKTTFLRTIALNSVLAQSINTCFADGFKTPHLRQFSSIRIDDNLFEGTSYYMQEVNIIGSLVAEVGSSDQNLFVIDEVFKGTNTVERIASAKAILSYLNRDINMVIVSTHDLELSEMLKQEFDLYHFTETIQHEQFHFDHKIKPGPLTTRNAIKILEISEYPSGIIAEAKKLSTALSQRSN